MTTRSRDQMADLAVSLEQELGHYIANNTRVPESETLEDRIYLELFARGLSTVEVAEFAAYWRLPHAAQADDDWLLGRLHELCRPDGMKTGSSRVKARLFTDGGARGNPGPAATGYVLEAEDGTLLDARGEAIGVATNNVAEYRALAAGLARAAEAGVSELEVLSDSELIVRQMTGVYEVKNEALRELWLEAGRLAQKIPRVSYKAVPREENERADRLVNEALDAA